MHDTRPEPFGSVSSPWLRYDFDVMRDTDGARVSGLHVGDYKDAS